MRWIVIRELNLVEILLRRRAPPAAESFSLGGRQWLKAGNVPKIEMKYI